MIYSRMGLQMAGLRTRGGAVRASHVGWRKLSLACWPWPFPHQLSLALEWVGSGGSPVLPRRRGSGSEGPAPWQQPSEFSLTGRACEFVLVIS